MKLRTVISTKSASRHVICAKTLKIFFLHAFQRFGRQQDKASYKFHLSVMQCTHRAVSIQWTLVSEGTHNRFGSQRKTLTRNFKVVFYLQPWSETVIVENAHVELLILTRLTVSCHS